MLPRACWTSVPNFMEIVQAGSISRERLNFRRRPILCTTLYRNLMQASNFGGTFDQLFLRIFFIKFSQKMPLYLFYSMVQKSQKWPKIQIKGGGSCNATSPLEDCLFPCVSTKSSYNFRKPKQLLLPKTHSTRHQQSFFYHASLLWNTLPNSTQQASSKETFKKEVERHWSHLKFDPQGRIPC